MSTLIFLFALVATLVPSALAHGRLDRLTIDGTAYQGNTVPPSNPIPNLSTPIRPVKDFTPIQGATNPALTCGKGATIANMVVPAKPGSFLTFSWKSGPSGNGPVSQHIICYKAVRNAYIPAYSGPIIPVL